ncbi:TPA: hypothetical protein EYP13_00160 [Candidatus Micrarchaeota archaeon]|nr:hypothetical protein [Candidatus Micrarchaeota archaeon]
MVTVWYKEKRTKEERRERYQMLRKLGYSPDIARRVRDWSDSHIELFIISTPHLRKKKEGEEDASSY